VYVERLEIRNFRCFEEAEVELNFPGREPSADRPAPRIPNANLFLGGNGSGKSSVFKALALAVLAPVIRSSGFKAGYLVRRRPDEPARVPGSDAEPVKDEAEVSACLRLEAVDADPLPSDARTTGRVRVRRTGDFEDIEGSDESDEGVRRRIFKNDSSAYFLVGYGANRRTERPEGYSEQSRSLRYQRIASLFEDHVGLTPFTFAHLQLRHRSRLDEARAILNALLPDEVSLTDQAGAGDAPLFERAGVLLPFEALSDGFRAYVGWVWDFLFHLARVETASAPVKQGRLTGAQYQRLHKALLTFVTPDGLRMTLRFYLDEDLDQVVKGANYSDLVFNLIGWAESQGRLGDLVGALRKENPGSPELAAAIEEFSGAPASSGAPKLSDIPGVVIVDEVDLFLHPEWQRIVIEQLAAAFPAIQFLFSSHSPLVAGTLHPANLYVLEGASVEQYRESIYGLTPNQVLTSSYFGLRSTRAPNTGTLAAAAGAAVGSEAAAQSVEEAEPADGVLAPEDRARRMLEEVGADIDQDPDPA